MYFGDTYICRVRGLERTDKLESEFVSMDTDTYKIVLHLEVSGDIGLVIDKKSLELVEFYYASECIEEINNSLKVVTAKDALLRHKDYMYETMVRCLDSVSMESVSETALEDSVI